MATLAANTWQLLKKRTHQDRIFTKLNAMHKALPIKFSYNMWTLDRLAELKNLIANIYVGSQAPTHREGSIVLMLNTLEDSDYESVHKHLLAQFQNDGNTPSQRQVYNAFAFVGYEHKQSLPNR